MACVDCNVVHGVIPKRWGSKSSIEFWTLEVCFELGNEDLRFVIGSLENVGASKNNVMLYASSRVEFLETESVIRVIFSEILTKIDL